MKNYKLYSKFAHKHNISHRISYDELEEIMEQQAREEETDEVTLAEEKNFQNK